MPYRTFLDGSRPNTLFRLIVIAPLKAANLSRPAVSRERGKSLKPAAD